jgi:hypothetical protein
MRRVDLADLTAFVAVADKSQLPGGVVAYRRHPLSAEPHECGSSRSAVRSRFRYSLSRDSLLSSP